MTYLDDNGNQTFERTKRETSKRTTTLVLKNHHSKLPACMIFYMKERLVRRLERLKITKKVLL